MFVCNSKMVGLLKYRGACTHVVDTHTHEVPPPNKINEKIERGFRGQVSHEENKNHRIFLVGKMEKEFQGMFVGGRQPL